MVSLTLRILVLVATAFVYFDAKALGDEDPYGWCLLVLFFGIFALVAYFTFKRPSLKQALTDAEELQHHLASAPARHTHVPGQPI